MVLMQWMVVAFYRGRQFCLRDMSLVLAPLTLPVAQVLVCGNVFTH
jgi:hypothetical protein